MNLTDDLTNGIIWKQLTALALPLIWGNILQQMYNTIDSFVVGHYIGETAFAAAGVAGSVMNLSLFVISGCCNGIAIIIAELYGQKNWDLLRKESFLSLAFGGRLYDHAEYVRDADLAAFTQRHTDTGRGCGVCTGVSEDYLFGAACGISL